MSKTSRVAFLCLALTSLLVIPAVAQGPAQIPSLPWIPRSDWINVRRASPAAAGDGITDDTAAIQACLNRLSDGLLGPKVVYFPPGRYRITSTLQVYKVHGVLLIGCGRDTRIIWDGAEDERMFWSNGMTYSRYNGITWDGRGNAAVGVDHDSKVYFETRIRHENEAFFNFRTAGIRVGHDQYLASAEMYYDNCLFRNCGAGVAFLQFNDYDNTFSGCEFYDCGYGIYCSPGNVYIRDCHFERSGQADIYLNPHSHSVRRCTSLDSAQFVVTGGPSTNACEITIQDCQVARWTNPEGAIVTRHRGPVTVFDCTFRRPPGGAPPINLANGGWITQTAILSNNQAFGSTALINPGPASRIYRIPRGLRGPMLTGAGQRFLKSEVPIPGKVFDAKRDFGAKGDGVTDDTDAIAAAIAAARMRGQGSLAYIPSGRYRITRTLNVTGRDYYIGGTGWHSLLYWDGPPGGVMMWVRDPQNVVIEHLSLDASDDSVTRILQTGTRPSSIRYDGVYAWCLTPANLHPNLQGFVFRELPAGTVVLGDHIDGNATFHNCSDATILLNVYYDGVFTVSGAQSGRSGFLGVLTRVSVLDPYGLIVRHNQDLVVGDYYEEQTDHFGLFEGGGPYTGRVSIKAARVHNYTPKPLTINGYQGRIAFCGGHFDYDPAREFRFNTEGPLDFVLLGNMFWNSEPVIYRKAGVRRLLLGNIVAPGSENAHHLVPDVVPRDGPLRFAEVLDDFRLLGEMDLQMNWGG